MITFLDERDVEHGALATIKVTNAVNGERSLTGEIESGDYVLANIERGWRLRFEDEFYVVTYAKPVDDGKATHVTFDAVHQFFWDFDKSSVHEQLNDGSHTFLTYLDFIFTGSDYTYTIDPLLKVYAFEKQSFGYKSRLKLFNDVITSSGVEFQVNGKVVRILEKTGTDLSTVVRKNFNMNELGIEKNIGDFVTYQKGFGAWVDENDHTKGRLVTEYTSPLASVYGKLEAEPLVDERYTQADNMVAALKSNVDNSYSLSVRLDMEDLTRAGYDYTQPRAGDYIMAINETLDFQEKIRIVSFTSEYDVTGQLIKHEVTCNDIGAVKKLSASYSLTKEQAQNASATVVKAVEMANKALISADGKSTVYFGTEFPEDEPKGELHKGDSLYLTVGDTTKMYYWTGADWEELPIVNDVKAFQDQINDELKDIPDRAEVETTINQKIATSKAEIKTQIDTAKSQAESNAKSYADEINQATAEVAEQANTAADALKTDLAKVKTDLTATTSTANSAKTSASEAKEQITTVANNLAKAKTDLTDSITAVDNKANAIQTDVTKAKSDIATVSGNLTKAKQDLQTSISSVDSKADGIQSNLTKTKTDLQSSIAVVDGKADTVQANLTKVKSDLQASINTVEGKIPTSVGGRNYLRGTSDQYQTYTNTNYVLGYPSTYRDWTKLLEPLRGKTVTIRAYIKNDTDYPVRAQVWFTAGGIYGNTVAPHSEGWSVKTGKMSADWTSANVALTQEPSTAPGGTIQVKKAKLEIGNIPTDWSPAPEDTASQISSLSSELSQTKAGMTLLATKTELNSAKSELNTSIATINTKATNLQMDVSNLNTSLSNTSKTVQSHATALANQAKDLQDQANQLTAQAEAQDALTTRVETVEMTANGTKSTVSELSKTVASNTNNITSVSNRTKTVETDLTSAKTSISELQTNLSSTQTGLTNLTKRTKDVEDDLSGTKTTLTELSQTVADDGETITGLTTKTATIESSVNGLKTSLTNTQKDLTSVTTRTKNVEDDLAGTKTSLTSLSATVAADGQTITSLSNKTKTIESNVDGLTTSLSNTQKNLTSVTNRTKTVEDTLDGTRTELAELQETVDTTNSNLASVTERTSTVESDLSGTKTSLSNLTKTVSDDGKTIASLSSQTKTIESTVSGLKTSLTSTQSDLAGITTRTKNVEDDLSGTKTELAELQTTVGTTNTNLANVTKRTKTVEDDLAGTKTSLSSLSQTVDNDGKNITSLTSRTKTVEDSVSGLKTTMSSVQQTLTSTTNRTKAVEDDLANTKTTLSETTTTANSASQKAATLETGLDGLSAKFNSLKIGGHNYLRGTSAEYQTLTSDNYVLGYTGNKNISFLDLLEPLKGETVTIRSYIKNDTDYPVRIQIWFTGGGIYGNLVPAHEEGYSVATGKILENFASCNVAFTQDGDGTKTGGTIQHKEDKLEKGNIATDYSPNEADLELKVADYKQTADQNYASLQSTVQNLDGTVTANKATADQTAAGFKTRIESLETYQSGESTRANQYFESAKTETARQLTAERTAIANDYVAKSTYTSDVTGLRNDLTATTTTANTTKTNLASYQASNDQAVASLQSSLQTTDGNVSSLQTKVEAVPGQITSAVSAVEGKIPTEVGGRNLIIRSQIQNGYIDNTGNLASSNSQFTTDFIDGTDNKQFTITAPKFGNGFSCFRLIKYDADKNFLGRDIISYTQDVKTVKVINLADNVAYFKVSFDGVYREPFKIERGNVATDYSLAPEDTASQISKLNTTLTQTAEGLTQLSTKVDTQGSTITSHTNSINSLNNQISAKVAKSEFDTLSGRVSNAETAITANASELSSKISAVESKVPTSVGGRNYLRGTSAEYQTLTSTNYVLGYTGNKNISFLDLLEPLKGKTVTIRSYIKNDTNCPVRVQIWFTGGGIYGNTIPAGEEGYSVATGKILENFASCNVAFTQGGEEDKNGGTIQHKEDKLEIGNIPSDWTPAPEDSQQDISNLSSELSQTKDGMALLATKTELNTAKSDLQNGISTATSKADNAQSTANTNAQTISIHTTQISALNIGLQAKVSQSDFDSLSGRVTTAESNLTATANQLSSQISSVNERIPSGEMNLIEYGRPDDSYNRYSGVNYVRHDYYYRGNYRCYALPNSTTNEVTFSTNSFKVERNTDYTLYFKGFADSKVRDMDVYYLARVKGSTSAWDGGQQLVKTRKLSSEHAEDVVITFNSGNYDEAFIRVDNNATTTDGQNAVLYFGDLSLKKGKSNKGWSPSLADLASARDLVTAKSEIKQTTDSISATVSALDNSTVKNSSLTINSDGIVMKAGKLTSDIANAIGSYFSVNQNAINLFSDKINVKGSMVVDGAITSTKIASKSINTAHLNGKIITADVIATGAITADAIKAGAITTDKMTANSINGDRITAGTLDAAKIKAGSITASQIASGTITSSQIATGTISAGNIATGAITTDKIAANSINSDKIVSSGITANVIKGGKLQSLTNTTNFDLDTGKLFYNNNNTGVFRVEDGASTMGLKFSNTAITVNNTSRILSRVILGGDRRETTLDDGKWDQGGFTGIVAETINGVDSDQHAQADTLRVIGDNIYFTHSYNYDSLTSTSAQGWKMETFSPFSSYAGNVVLKPYGINYRQSDIITGDIRLDNGDGSGYWVRGCIRTLRNCFQHYLNGGTSSGAMNAIRDALREISGV